MIYDDTIPLDIYTVKFDSDLFQIGDKQQNIKTIPSSVNVP